MLSFLKKNTFLICSLLGGIFLAFSQKNTVRITENTDYKTINFEDTTRRSPVLLVKLDTNASVPLEIKTLKINSEISGHNEITTMEFEFLNSNNRTLEGNFYFPLDEGTQITNFWMELNGVMRPASVVEKEKGRVAFESTIRQKVDPALLEWSAGNNFNIRVYPLLPNKTKKVKVEFIKRLEVFDGKMQYFLPLNYDSKISDFQLNINITGVDENSKLELNDAFPKNKLNRISTSNLNFTYKNIIPNKSFLVRFETDKNEVELSQNELQEVFFSTYIQPKSSPAKQELKSKITLLWDNSNSSQSRDKTKEFLFLTNYIQKVKDLEIEIIPFSFAISPSINLSIQNGNYQELIELLNNLKPDGATNFSCLSAAKINYNEVFLFSDCLHNFGKENFNTSKENRIHVFNSSANYNPSFSNYISLKTGGNSYNLSKQTSEEILKDLEFSPIELIEVVLPDGSEIANPLNRRVKNGIYISGKLKEYSNELIFKFGYNGKVTEEIKLNTSISQLSNNHQLPELFYVKDKLDYLDYQYESNKEMIVTLSKSYNLVSRYTSFLILDRIEDYVEHEVIPPSSMINEYNKLIAAKEKKENSLEKESLKKIIERFETVKEWWAKDFNPEPLVKLEEKKTGETMIATDSGVYDMEISLGYSMNANSVSFSSSRTETTLANKSKSSEEGFDATIKVSNWDPKTPYMKAIKTGNSQSAYSNYLIQKETYGKQPSFYLDASDYFLELNDSSKALLVLSNIAELELENVQLMRILGHRLLQLKKVDFAIYQFEKIVELKAEEPQTFRDLAHAYEAKNEVQKAIDTYRKVIYGKWDDRFYDIATICLVEMNHLISTTTSAYDVSKFNPLLIKKIPVDIRVIITWDTDNCDIDLWVTDPRNEKCFYSHQLTALGGRISDDFTGGYGPEEFMLKKAMKGKYKVQAHYYGSTAQSISGLTTIHVKLITNYGRPNEKTVEITRRLEEKDQEIDLAEFDY
jgi:Vault protein inter-alpha-trypsin domain/Uncharacterized protein conserved in bacteria (DUF2135)